MDQLNRKEAPLSPKLICVILLIILVACAGMLFIFKGLLSIGLPDEPLLIEAPKDEKINESH
jgi:hypothetical protein